MIMVFGCFDGISILLPVYVFGLVKFVVVVFVLLTSVCSSMFMCDQ